MDLFNLDGGAYKKKKAAAPKKKAASVSAWKNTGRKVMVKGAEKSLYKNASTGKLAYRKKVAGTSSGAPSKFRFCAVPTTTMRG